MFWFLNLLFFWLLDEALCPWYKKSWFCDLLEENLNFEWLLLKWRLDDFLNILDALPFFAAFFKSFSSRCSELIFYAFLHSCLRARFWTTEWDILQLNNTSYIISASLWHLSLNTALRGCDMQPHLNGYLLKNNLKRSNTI